MKDIRVPVIIVTDGDDTARAAIEVASHDLNLFPLRMSAGNPTTVTGPQVVNQVIQAPIAPVVIMVDDHGEKGVGPGEQVLEYLLQNTQVQVLGVVAIASNTRVKGIPVHHSVTAQGQLVSGAVNKAGDREPFSRQLLRGDTVEILQRHPDILVIGCGDLGKMHQQDGSEQGAAITSRCLQEILNWHHQHHARFPCGHLQNSPSYKKKRRT